MLEVLHSYAKKTAGIFVEEEKSNGMLSGKE